MRQERGDPAVHSHICLKEGKRGKWNIQMEPKTVVKINVGDEDVRRSAEGSELL